MLRRSRTFFIFYILRAAAVLQIIALDLCNMGYHGAVYQQVLADMLGNSSHKQGRHTITDLPDPFLEFSGEYKAVRERTEPLELRQGEPPLFTPMHCPVHPEIAVIAADSPRRLIGIELHGIEALACNMAF